MIKQTPVNVDDATASPYVVCSVICPMCGLHGVQYRLNPRQFWHTNRDLDLQPSEYHFRGISDKVHPPLLAMWHCNGCYFTAQTNDFQDPLKDVLIRTETVAFALSELARTDNSFRKTIETLHADIHLDALDFYQSIKLHLLAYRLWDEIGGMVKQDYMIQAKYSLLLAWLYRDLQTIDPDRAQTMARLRLLSTQLQRDWPEMPTTEEVVLRKAIDYYDASLSINTFVKDPLNEVTALHRIGRIQMKMGEYALARESFQKSTSRALAATAEMRRQLAIRGNAPGREEVTGVEREALLDRERRLSSIIVDEGRLSDTIQDILMSKVTKRR